MPRPSVSAAVASMVLAVGFLAPAGLAHAATADEPAVDTGRVEIPYGEPGDLRPAPGWAIDCASLPTLEQVEVTCLPDGLTLTAPFDPDAGEQLFPVTLVAGATTTVVQYRVALAPPAPVEVGAATLDVPLPVGAQTLVPLSVFQLTCGLCAEGSVEILGVEPASALVGVGDGHLSVRPVEPGHIVVSAEFTDDAGQKVAGEIDLYATPAPADSPAPPRTLHVVTPEREVDLSTLVWGDDTTITCLAPLPGVSCSPEGGLEIADEVAGVVQVAFRVVDAAGRQALGSVTVDPDAEDAPIPVSWATDAPLGIGVPPPPGDDEAQALSLLDPLSRLIQEVPAS